jgi:hypothetical protein
VIEDGLGLPEEAPPEIGHGIDEGYHADDHEELTIVAKAIDLNGSQKATTMLTEKMSTFISGERSK